MEKKYEKNVITLIWHLANNYFFTCVKTARFKLRIKIGFGVLIIEYMNIGFEIFTKNQTVRVWKLLYLRLLYYYYYYTVL